MLVTPARLSRAIAVLAVCGAIAMSATPAQAHGELVSSTPADGATLTELTSVRLQFSEELLEIGNSVTVTDSADAAQQLVLAYPQPNVIEAPVGAVAPGAVTIAWRSASVDGHTEEGELHVTLEAPETSPTPAVTLTETATSPDPLTSPTAAVTSVEPASGPNPWLLAALGLAIIGGAGAAIIAATRRQPGEAPGPAEEPGTDETPGAGE